ADLAGDPGGRADEAAGAGDVEEGLVDRDRLDVRGVLAEEGHHLPGDLAVGGGGLHEHAVGAAAARHGGGHGGVDAVFPGLVGGRGDDASGAEPGDDHGSAAQGGVAGDLDGREEGVHVHVHDRQLLVGEVGTDEGTG